MEGFGIFIVIAYVIYWVTRQVRINNTNRDLKKLAKDRGADHYDNLAGQHVTMDDQPFQYMVLDKNGTPQYYWKEAYWDKGLDVVMVNSISGKVIRNISAEERKVAEIKGKEWAKKNGWRIYPISTERELKYATKHSCDRNVWTGVKFRDEKTGNTYIIRRVEDLYTQKTAVIGLFNIQSLEYEGVLNYVDPRSDHQKDFSKEDYEALILKMNKLYKKSHADYYDLRHDYENKRCVICRDYYGVERLAKENYVGYMR